jgi:hypothetical protein
MESNRFIKILWTVNGLLILGTFLVVMVALSVEFFGDLFYTAPRKKVIVGEDLASAKKEGLILQGLEYQNPERILNSEFYILPVSLKTYSNPRQRKVLNYASADIKEIDDVVNVIFLNKALEIERILLDRKAFIESFRYPGEAEYEGELADTFQRHITYQIAFADSNQDGLIDSDDNLELYLSELDGSDLTKVISDVDVQSYEFMQTNLILIRYNERSDEDLEHKKEYFAVYNIKDKTLKKLASVHKALDEIENLVTQ